MKRILCITATMNQNGLLSQLMKKIKAMADQKNIELEIVDLYSQTIAPCRGCKQCVTQKCNMEDSVTLIDHKIETSDVVLLLAPTYFANVPGIVKNLFDRLYYRTKKGKKYENKKYILVTTCDTPKPFHVLLRQSTGTATAVKNFFSMVGIKKAGVVTIAGVQGKETVPEKAIHKLYELLRMS